MRRVLVVSRNPAMAVGLQTPDNEIAEVRPGALPAWLNSHFEALDVVVLDLGRPEETAQALDLTRSLFPAIPVLAVAGPVPGWDAPVFSDAGVAVLELPVTRTRLLQAVAILGTDTAARTARLRHTSSVVFKQVPIEPRSEGPEVIDFNAPEPAGHVAPQEDRAAARAEELAEVEALEVLPAVEPPVVEEPHVVEEPAIVDGFPVAEECPVVEEPRTIAEPAAEQETPDIAPEHEPASLQPEPEPEPAEEAPETRALPEPSLRGVTPIAVS